MKSNYYVHPSSIIDEPCRIGEGTKIWHFCHIMKNAEIGKNCKLGQNVFIASEARVGNNVKVQNNVSIFNGITCQDDVFIGPSVVFTNVINPRSHVERKKEYQATLVKKGATIGANATIVCGHVIGEYAFIGAGAVVTDDVPDHGLVYGTPATLKGYMCRCANKLDFQDEQTAVCSACGESYFMAKGQVRLDATKN